MWCPAGIPLIFPQFGPLGPMKSHGFARNATWACQSHKSGDGEAEVTLVLTNSQEHAASAGTTPLAPQEHFPNTFRCFYTVKLSGAQNSRLQCSWTVDNLASGARCRAKPSSTPWLIGLVRGEQSP